MPEGDGLQHLPGSVPVPDPTVLTTQSLLREIAGLKELLLARIEAAREIRDEKFASVDTQFKLVEQQRVEQKQDTKAAVDAALAAAKEAVKEQTTAQETAINKSENSMTERLAGLGTTFDTAGAANRRDIDDLKNRVTAIETYRTNNKETSTQTWAALGVMLLGLAVTVTILVAVFKK